MANKIKQFSCLLFVLVCFSTYSNATNTFNALGSNTVYALSVQENYSISQAVWGMVDYQDGFSVNSTVTLGLGLTGPIRSGNLDFADGSNLYLWTDLHLGSGVDINIDGPSGGTLYIRGNDNVIFFDSNLTLSSGNKIMILENTIFDFQGNDLIFEDGGQIIVVDDAALVVKNAHIKNLNGLVSSGASLAMTSIDSWLILDDVILNLSGTYTLDQGAFVVRNNVIVQGEDQTFSFSSKYDAYSSKARIAIDENSKLMFDLGTILRYQNFSTSVTSSMANSLFSQSLILMTDFSSKLHFNGSIVRAPIDTVRHLGGLLFSGGTLIFENRVILDALNEDGTVPDINYWPDNTIPYYYPAILWGLYPFFKNVNVEILAGSKIELYGNLLVGNND